jgi:hypothetical protein
MQSSSHAARGRLLGVNSWLIRPFAPGDRPERSGETGRTRFNRADDALTMDYGDDGESGVIVSRRM